MLLQCQRHFIFRRELSGAGGQLFGLSALGSLCSAGVSHLVGCSLNVIVNLVFADDGGRAVVADVAVKSFKFRVVAVYVSNIIGERRSFFRRFGPFLDVSKRLVLMSDWNTIFDSKLDKGGQSVCGSDRCESSLIDLLAEFDLVDRFRLDHPGQEMWTWLGDSPSGQVQSYLDRVLKELTVTPLLVPRSTR